MADTLQIRIDLERLATNLAGTERIPLSPDEVVAFLRQCGFIDLGDGLWGCEEISLRALDRSEWFPDLPRPSGRCWCGYDLSGNVSGRCPECGRSL